VPRTRGKGGSFGVPSGRPRGHGGWGEETPSEPESSGDGDEEQDEDEEEGEIIPSVPCSPPDIIPSLDDLFSQIGGDLRWRALGEMPSGGNRGIFRATTIV
jgi:hypothetical protein